MPTFGVLERLLEGLDPVGKDARRLEPFEEVGARAELDPLVAELGDLRGKLLEREVAVHERVEGDLHDVAPRCAGQRVTGGSDRRRPGGGIGAGRRGR